MVKHRREQRSLILYSTRLTQSRNQRLRFSKRDGWLNSTLRFLYDLRRKLTRISKPNVTRIKILRTKTCSLTQRSTDNAATYIRRASIRRRELMAGKITRRPTQVHI